LKAVDGEYYSTLRRVGDTGSRREERTIVEEEKMGMEISLRRVHQS
jgi:hypothetical protein